MRKHRWMTLGCLCASFVVLPACSNDILATGTELCGNGQLDDGEECDGSEFPEDASCPKGMSLPDGKNIVCTELCKLDVSDCAKKSDPEKQDPEKQDPEKQDPQKQGDGQKCGNEQLDEGEICDGDLISGEAACPGNTVLPEGMDITCNSDCSLNTDACSQCGNGQIDDGETCDGESLPEDVSCPEGFFLPEGMQITCRPDCSLDMDVCTQCGNGQIDEGETCDGELLPEDVSCPEGFFLPEGMQITCQPDCSLGMDVCTQCGNGQIDEGEECDGTLMPEGAACAEGMILPEGTALSCRSDCTLNTDACTRCGNGQIDEGEVCDGTSMPEGAACPDGMVLPKETALSCRSDCTLNTDACTRCGNGQIDEGEACDGTNLNNAKCPSGTELPSGKALSCNADCSLNTSACVKPCHTRIEYGSTWNHGPNHPSNVDEVDGKVTWDGNCQEEGGNSYATLSNGWKPYFKGYSCLISLNYTGNCGEDNVCRTRVKYNSNWKPAPGNTNYYDDVKGVVTWSGLCSGDHVTLSNGWTPYFSGACKMALRYTQCGPLFLNPVIPSDFPDPGAILVDGTYYVVGTGGNTTDAYYMRSSKDLVNWTNVGYAFKNGSGPSWAKDNFWAPELHKVDNHYNIYYSVRNKNTGRYCVGVGTSDKVTGPYKDKGQPLVCKDNVGVIDASHFTDSDGKNYVLWKDDGNALGKKTPVFIQELTKDGLSLVGKPTQILTNDQNWEGSLIEGPWLIKRGSYYYLFYSANGYASSRYAVGVARSKSLLGPYTKHSGSILHSQGHFQGPGHGSVLQAPSGEWFHIYHTWIEGAVGYNNGGKRVVAVDRIDWIDDWPQMYSAPMYRSQPVIR
ncbi:MAG: family 43 glycosylhydrolase [Proteobacteria bacterium]|nr:family 43 glycosylhydrolase [Pseudomonadota bacterium]